MKWTIVRLLGLRSGASVFALVFGCVEEEPATSGDAAIPGAPISTGDRDPAGGGGSGAVECSSDLECTTKALQAARSIADPAPLERPTLSSRCEWGHLSESLSAIGGTPTPESRPICLCSWSAETPDQSYVAIGDHGPACFAVGRAHQCLFTPADFLGCDVTQAASCRDDCAAFDAARAADAAARHDVAIVEAGCEHGSCYDVTRVGPNCHANGQHTPYECALGVPEILRRARADARAALDALSGGGFPIATQPSGQVDPRRWMRPADEWQGMNWGSPLQQLAPPCSTSAACGMARACVEQLCVPCLEDRECAAGEVCALGHCVLQANASCRSRRDCRASDALCILSGYTGNDPRSNSDMRAYCLSPSGGSAL